MYLGPIWVICVTLTIARSILCSLPSLSSPSEITPILGSVNENLWNQNNYKNLDDDNSYHYSQKNPRRFNIGAILSDRQHILTFIKEIELINNISLAEVNITLHATAFEMSTNPIHTAQDVCEKLIQNEVYAIIVSHPQGANQLSPTSVSFTGGFYNIPVIGISNRDSSLSNKILHSSFLRIIPPYSHQADVWIQMLRYMEYKSVVIIHSSDSDGRSTLSRFQDLADKSSLKVASIIEYESGISNSRDELNLFKNQFVQELTYVRQNFHCRVYILYSNAQDAEIIFEEIHRQQMDGAGYVWIVSEQALSASNRPDGVLSLKLKHSEERLMIKDSVASLSRSIQEMVYSQKITSPPTDCRLTSTNKWQTGAIFYKHLQQQKFDGHSGRVTFDESGDRLFSEYDILNTVNQTDVTVGRYSFDLMKMKMELFLQLQKVKWPGNQKEKPLGYYVPNHLRVATLPEKPFVWIKPVNEVDLEHSCLGANQVYCPKKNITTGQYEHYCCEGYCVELLAVLAQKLNFTYHLEIVADGQYGSLDFVDGYNNPRRWTGLVGELVSKHVDMVVAPLTANPERSQVISFSKPFKYEGITILQKRQPKKSTLASFLQPFHNKLWFLVLISVHVVAMALYLLDRFSPFGNYQIENDLTWVPNHQRPIEERSLNVSSAIWFSWGVLLNSGIGERTPRSFSARVLGMVWAGFAMIVVASYTANLAAYLVLNPRDDHALSGIEDSRLRNPTESFTFATVKGSAVDTFFRSQVHLFNAYRTMEEINYNSPEEAIDALKKGELDAFIWDSPRLEYEAAQDCDLVISGELFGRSGYGIGLQKNSFWTDDVTLALLQMHESGFMESLDSKWILATEDRDCESKLEHFPYTLGMKNMAGVFLLVFFGIVMAFGLIVIEIIYKKRRARRHRRTDIARKMGLIWKYKSKRNSSKNISKSVHSLISSRNDCGPQNESEYQYGYSPFPIPPPPPPPMLSTQRMPQYFIDTYGAGGNNKQRTAQQKIYEFKHRNFAYY